MSKKRILFSNEASFTASGYGTYGHAVLNYLYDTGKYEVAEHATYGVVNDSRDKDIRWKYYANAVSSNDPRYTTYKSRPENQFGAWRFERVLLDFKPDIVFSIRDPYPYIMQWEGNSPLRRFFHYVVMPTVDSAPQQYEWIDYFMRADGVLTYSYWGSGVLRDQSSNMIKLHGTASPGVDTELFKPVNKEEHRDRMGFEKDAIIIGTVMRNQRRKLYPDLLLAFKNYLKAAPELTEKSYLYLHVSYPEGSADISGLKLENGWKIPELILEYGLSSKVILTYVCASCKKPFSAFFRDGRTVCPNCHKLDARPPSVINGVERRDLSNIMNLFDVYVQLSNVEGWGMPIVEAASCGVPVMVTNSSAMTEIARKTHGYTIDILKESKEIDLGAMRAIPDPKHLTELLVKFFRESKEFRAKKAKQARQGVEENYTWKHTGQKWEKYFDSVVLTGEQGKWDAPAKFIQPAQQIPQDLNTNDFVRFALAKILCRPELLDTYIEYKLTKELNYDSLGKGQGRLRQDIIDKFLIQADNYNHVEQGRINPSILENPDYIQYANLKYV